LSDESRERLLSAYRATTYRADVEGRSVDLRIGAAVALDGPLAGLEWAFVTAANPGSRLLESAANLLRHERLKARLADCDVVLFEGQGVPDAADWEPEISLLVLGIGREQAVAIGRDFGQLAIVCGRPGGVAELVACTQSKS
jgi:hypothetical protein